MSILRPVLLVLALTLALTGCTTGGTDDPDRAPRETESADRSAAAPQSASIEPQDRAAVRTFLREGGTTANVATLMARLGRGLTAMVEQFRRTTAVAVTARPHGDDCVVGRRGPGGRVLVWVPDRILTMPGEYGCRPSLAVDFPPGYVAGA